MILLGSKVLGPFFSQQGQRVLGGPQMYSQLYFWRSLFRKVLRKEQHFSLLGSFFHWVFGGPTQGVVAYKVEHAEEIYTCMLLKGVHLDTPQN